MSKDNVKTGKTGEDIAAEHLCLNGYKILKRNYRTKFSELDIIAQDKDTICFIEVKCRKQQGYGLPEESVIQKKQDKIVKAALCYLKENGFLERNARFDVVAVNQYSGKTTVDIIKDAFQAKE